MALFEGELGTALHGTVVEFPHFYLIYGPDDDARRHNASYGTLADMLQPCRVTALGFDGAIAASNTLAEAASLYARRVRDDLVLAAAEIGGGVASDHACVIVGYGLVAALAHRAAVELCRGGQRVALVLLDSEPEWPRHATGSSASRLGAYAWQGAELEAALLACRAVGQPDIARQELSALLAGGRPAAAPCEQVCAYPARLGASCDGPPASVHAAGGLDDAMDDKLMAIYWKLARATAMPRAYFDRYVQDTGFVLQRIRDLSHKEGRNGQPGDFHQGGQAHREVFHGPALLVLAHKSPEFREGALSSGGELCSQLHTVEVPGTHYDMCQRVGGGVPTAVPQAISEFLALRGFYGKDAETKVEAAVSAGGGQQRLADTGVMDIVD